MTQDEKFPNKNEIKKVLENMNIKFVCVCVCVCVWWRFKVLTNDAHNGSTCFSVNHSCNVEIRGKDEKKKKMKKREI